MTVREELIREIDRASDDLLQVLLNFLRQIQIADPTHSFPNELADAFSSGNSTSGNSSQKHYPLRGMPLKIGADFDAPMSDLWDALGE